MANTPQDHQTGGSGNAPVERFNDGAVKASIFRNVSKEGRPFYNVTFARIYTDPQTGQIAETQSFSGTDILKVRRLADQAYHAVDRLRKQERSQNSDPQNGHKGSQSLSEQRDMLMNDTAQNRQGSAQSPQHGQDQSQPELEQ
ncbi:hypothetical protein HPDFL43_00007520 [Hoeflea phototrophica DFL-43]|uniref:Uncharacterized protein n=1 Tax=Hoeflea phototrophica (strain DSM 17068 / NCIMB 14078 / DFL-43) TaxID=411684 RepID=A0A094Z098_HOEPD|nr:hypothetical protein [Hoeflea phototrophica]KGB27082.1 hypothetical protein HPDFL43_00007520 [Hoeflea phototrophica DFL-43]